MKNKLYSFTLIMAFVLFISQANAQVQCNTPGSLTTSNITQNSATVSWAAVSNVAFYNVQYRLSSNATWTTITVQIASANLMNLLCNSSYQWKVQSACPNGVGAVTLSAFSAPVPFTTSTCNNTCGVPTGLFANNNAPTSVTLHWNSTGATTYKIRYRPTGTTAWTNKSSSTNSKNLTGLTPATAYQWQVRSRCVDALTGVVTLSAWSPISYFQTTGTTTCATPTGLTAVVNSANGVQLAWNSTGATSYNIRYRPANTTTWLTTTSATNSKTLSQVLGNTVYEWQVQGVCQNTGTSTLSAWSASAFFTTNAPLAIAPNPASDKIVVTFQTAAAQQVNLTIRDFLGTEYAVVSKSSAEGVNQYELNVSSLKNGIYYLEVNGAEGRQTSKFYVQH